MIRACLWLLAGAMAPQLISFPSGFDQLFTGLVAFGVAALVLRPVLRRVDMFLFIAAFALFWLAVEHEKAGRLDPAMAGDSLLTTLRIDSFPTLAGNSAGFWAAAVADARIPARIHLRWQEPPVTPRIGDVWRAEIRLRPPRGSSNPGGMDYEAWLLRERVGATGYVVNGKHNVLLDSRTVRGLARVRERFVARATSVLGDDPALAVVVAVAVGARHLISDEAWERYARTGTSHLMAISGLHVGLAAIAIYLLALPVFGLLSRRNHHLLALLAALSVAIAYALLSGFAVPARRASLMLALLTFALLLRREPSGLRILAAVIVILVLSDPLTTMAPGFKLSFAAVAILLWLARQSRYRPDGGAQRLRLLHSTRSLITMQFLLLIGLMPLTIVLFGRVSLAAPFINLLAVPLFSFVTVPLVLLSVVLPDALQYPLELALHGAAMSINLLERLIVYFAESAQAAKTIAALEGPVRLLLLVPIVWIILPRGWPGRQVAWLAAAALVLWRPAQPPTNCVDIRALDVGQGMSWVLTTRNRVLVYDTGPAWRGGANAGDRVLVPYLHYRGIDRVDRLVVSHADLDHSGGTQALLDSLAVDELLVGEKLDGIEAAQSICNSAMAWQWSGVDFSFLHPPPAANIAGNEASCVLLVEAGEHSFLLTGDIEAQSEAQLVRQRRLPQVDVVTVPHHGSRTSSIAPFVRSLTPKYAIVSAGYGNRWGFPKADVVARWRAGGAEVLNTADGGSISLRMCAEIALSRPTEWRNRLRRIWHEDDS